MKHCEVKQTSPTERAKHTVKEHFSIQVCNLLQDSELDEHSEKFITKNLLSEMWTVFHKYVFSLYDGLATYRY